jgi:hypothetical protein
MSPLVVDLAINTAATLLYASSTAFAALSSSAFLLLTMAIACRFSSNEADLSKKSTASSNAFRLVS